MSRVLRRTGVLGATVGALLFPAAADAAVTCDYAASGKHFEVRMTASNDLAQVGLSGSTNLEVRNLFGVVACTSNPPATQATVTNTDAITISSEIGVQNVTLIIDDVGGMAPGATADPVGDSEIEIGVNLRNGPSSMLSIRAGDFPSTVRFGTAGINPNALSTEVSPDVDIFPMNVPELDARGAFAVPVNFNASGGAGTGGPLTMPLEFQGSSAGDILVGGDGNDRLQAFGSADVLVGGPGDDTLDSGTGADSLDGGLGTDVADYSLPNYPAGVSVDLAAPAPQTSGGSGADTLGAIENVRGTFQGDALRGDAGSNRLEGGPGPDIVEGRGGLDELLGAGGTDVIDARDGGPDTVDCGPDTDDLIADLPGVDTVTGCEDVLFPPSPTPTTPGGNGTGDGTTPPATVAISLFRITPQIFSALAKGPSAVPSRRRRGAIVSFALNRAATVVYRVARRLPGRRVAGRCRKPTRLNAGARRCTRLVRLRGSFRRAGETGPNRFRFTGRLRGRRLRPGSYQLRARPAADGVSGAVRRARFRIVR